MVKKGILVGLGNIGLLYDYVVDDRIITHSSAIDKCNAVDPLEVDTAYLVPIYFEKFLSKSIIDLSKVPEISPLAKAFKTEFLSDLLIIGLKTGIIFSL